MKAIDADAHVIEGEAIWDLLEPHDRKYRPIVVDIPTSMSLQPQPGAIRRNWLTDGAVQPLPGDEGISIGVRELTDVKGRLAKMDELEIDIQVIYPSIFLVRPTDQPEGLVALSHAYNRFMADVWQKSNNRLPWIIVPAVDSMPEALAELEFGKLHGACGVMVHGIEGSRVLSNPYYHPLFAKAEALDLPVCVHVGAGNRSLRGIPSAFFNGRSPVLTGFHDLILSGVPDRFPKLRFGFIEAGAQWIPYLLSEVRRRTQWVTKQMIEQDRQVMRKNRMFVSCRVDDDIPYLVSWAGKKNLMTGTDMGHDDYSRDIFAFRELRKSGGDAEAIDGILAFNAREFYGL